MKITEFVGRIKDIRPQIKPNRTAYFHFGFSYQRSVRYTKHEKRKKLKLCDMAASYVEYQYKGVHAPKIAITMSATMSEKYFMRNFLKIKKAQIT